MNGFLLASTEHVAVGVTCFFALLLVGLIVCLALEEKLHAKKSVIAGVFAVVCLFFGAVADILPFDKIVVGSHPLVDHTALRGELLDESDQHTEPFIAPSTIGEADESDPVHVQGHRISMPVYIPGIDWGVIAIIFGSSIFVDVTSRSGLFSWIAIRVTKASRGDPLLLLISYGVMTVVFSAVLNNVTAMIIVGSLTVVSLEKLGQRDKLLGFLLIEGLLTNVGGLLTLISSVPNIIVGTAADISFVTFFIKAAPYVLVTTAATIWLGARILRVARLSSKEEQQEAADLVASFDENDGVASWNFFYFAAVTLGLFIVTIATTSVLPWIRELEMGFVALAFAGVMLVRYKSEADQFYKAVDWDLLGFFMALFVVIYIMEHAHVLKTIGVGLEGILTNLTSDTGDPRDAAVLLVGAAAFSSVTDNIPLAAMLANILHTLGAPETSRLWWSVIFGANLGGNLTPIGSASTLVAVTIIHKHELHLTFIGFVKTAAPFALMHIVLALLYVLLILPWLPG